MANGTDSIGSQIAAVASQVAWPLVVLIVFGVTIHNAHSIATFFEQLAKSYKSFNVSVSGTGVSLKADAKEIANGITFAVASVQNGKVSPEQASQAQRAAQTAATEFASTDVLRPEKRLTVLWVDDQPGNNAGLQYALQALGIVVVCVEDTDRIQEAAAAMSGVDVVVTDMFRNAVRSKPDQQDAGLKTIDEVRNTLKGVPVIVYAGGYAAAHQSDPLVQPVHAITNNPETVFSLITQMAKVKALAKA